MHFRPRDEISLRHLFSSQYCEELLHMSYIGPVLSPSGNILTSPDCIILDRRVSPFKTLRCEFKYLAAGKKNFEENGQFDIAIVWGLRGITKEQLRVDLKAQHGCREVVVLTEDKAFLDLPEQSVDAESLSLQLEGADVVKEIALKRRYSEVFALLVAAKVYPDKFSMRMLVDLLCSRRFKDVLEMQPKGRSNVVAKFLQTKPALLKWMHGEYYRWNNAIDNRVAVDVLTQLIRSRFEEELPKESDVAFIRA
jgi:hypothetical protein